MAPVMLECRFGSLQRAFRAVGLPNRRKGRVMSLVGTLESRASVGRNARGGALRLSAGASDVPPSAKHSPPMTPIAERLRPRLTARLNPAPVTRAALLVAPPGAGKSALVSQWSRAPGTQHRGL